MSVRHPIISVTGSSGGGTTTVRRTFEQIFRREKVNAVFIEGDAFHRYNRQEMRDRQAAAENNGNRHFSHFSPENNLLEELEETFADYGRDGSGRFRHYVHDSEEEQLHGSSPGTFTEWDTFPAGSDLLFYEGLHGAVVT